uniref:Uncharacterized protein n=1 Tax=Cucumis sativus TaxID=3659 RepID=A0A0A0KF47_CUCSA
MVDFWKQALKLRAKVYYTNKEFEGRFQNIHTDFNDWTSIFSICNHRNSICTLGIQLTNPSSFIALSRIVNFVYAASVLIDSTILILNVPDSVPNSIPH